MYRTTSASNLAMAPIGKSGRKLEIKKRIRIGIPLVTTNAAVICKSTKRVLGSALELIKLNGERRDAPSRTNMRLPGTKIGIVTAYVSGQTQMSTARRTVANRYARDRAIREDASSKVTSRATITKNKCIR